MCPLAKVEHLLEEAAEIVVCKVYFVSSLALVNMQIQIRSLLPEDEHFQLEGSSKEYLLSLESLPSEEEFVLGVLLLFRHDVADFQGSFMLLFNLETNLTHMD
jgi:hypothetical protein